MDRKEERERGGNRLEIVSDSLTLSYVYDLLVYVCHSVFHT